MKRSWLAILAVALAVVSLSGAPAPGPLVGINVVLKVSPDIVALAQLGVFGKVRDVIPEINGVTMQAAEKDLAAIRALPFVEAAGVDQPRGAGPVQVLAATDFLDGLNTWDLDAIDVTDLQPGPDRTIAENGAGVYVAVLDTGLLSSWRFYFPEERINTDYARSFGGGGGDVGFVSSQPNKWERDQNSHGTHVTSTILGYNLLGTPINGVAPMATVIPVKVLNQNGSGWSSVVAHGITYVADLKAGPLHAFPVVINMSLGGPGLDPLEKAAIDYAIDQGVIVVAAAGNAGNRGMDYPGAYAPVISVAAAGWVGEWIGGNSWWLAGQVPDPGAASDFYITSFSGRQKTGQDLDVAAPGSWVVGPFQTNGQISYFFLGGTSMATPHVAGIVALMAQKNPALTAMQAETALEQSTIALPPGCRNVNDGSGRIVNVCWGADAAGSGLVNAPGAIAQTPQ